MIESLLHECKKNNTQAQEQLYKLLAPKLFAVSLKYSRNHEEAQDNLQESFLIIFEKLKQFNGNGSFEGWAKRLVVNYVLQQYRKQGAFLELVSDKIPNVEEVEIDDESVTMEFLLKIIQELPDRYRLVFNLYVVDGYSHKEIAEMLEITDGTSKSNLARAKMILKEKIQKYNTAISRTK
ncbi:RNA polymerase sigma factor [Flavobacterium terrigena]|uniref:RNA polymerase sigma-70 factor, ECF subfamily n=2 Tax=Flavobacterium terrigena TaxID=402734 RepID=A0A1H6TKK5_9FLAO|nr:RNA polymerase sigma-70 factor, ECF subfamily [Flavobacterium terrigena]